jgi:hypothetical protein
LIYSKLKFDLIQTLSNPPPLPHHPQPLARVRAPVVGYVSPPVRLARSNSEKQLFPSVADVRLPAGAPERCLFGGQAIYGSLQKQNLDSSNAGILMHKTSNDENAKSALYYLIASMLISRIR